MNKCESWKLKQKKREREGEREVIMDQKKIIMATNDVKDNGDKPL